MEQLFENLTPQIWSITELTVSLPFPLLLPRPQYTPGWIQIVQEIELSIRLVETLRWSLLVVDPGAEKRSSHSNSGGHRGPQALQALRSESIQFFLFFSVLLLLDPTCRFSHTKFVGNYSPRLLGNWNESPRKSESIERSWVYKDWESDTIKQFMNSWTHLRCTCIDLIVNNIPHTLRMEQRNGQLPRS